MSLFNRLRKNPCADYTDDDFVRMIQGGSASEQAFRCLTQLYLDMVRKTTGYKGLSREDVLTAYSEAFVQLRKNVMGDQFQAKGSLRAYFSQIFKNKCFDILRKQATIGKKETSYEDFPVQIPDSTYNAEQQIIEDEEELAQQNRQEQRKVCLHKASSQLTQRENDYLNDFYVNKIKPKEMSQRYALKDERSASTTAVTYRKKLKEAILNICQTDPTCRVLCSK